MARRDRPILRFAVGTVLLAPIALQGCSDRPPTTNAGPEPPPVVNTPDPNLDPDAKVHADPDAAPKPIGDAPAGENPPEDPPEDPPDPNRPNLPIVNTPEPPPEDVKPPEVNTPPPEPTPKPKEKPRPPIINTRPIGPPPT
ncbi:MAG: hypothetical protein R3B09_00470 [Nannocystaceae bacterium]